jgi:hypothetical protein
MLICVHVVCCSVNPTVRQGRVSLRASQDLFCAVPFSSEVRLLQHNRCKFCKYTTIACARYNQRCIQQWARGAGDTSASFMHCMILWARQQLRWVSCFTRWHNQGGQLWRQCILELLQHQHTLPGELSRNRPPVYRLSHVHHPLRASRTLQDIRFGVALLDLVAGNRRTDWGMLSLLPLSSIFLLRSETHGSL